jgi:hypothetical protein
MPSYSPNLVEGLFRELRAEGVLGNPHRFAVGCASLGTFGSRVGELGARD